jgi:uncharacterized protein (TIGR02118 family)
MHCLTVIYPRPDDEAAFKSYYEQYHVPLAARLPGLKRMQVAYPEAISPSDVFCIFQGYFEDGAAMGSAMQSEIGRQVAADLPNYSPKGAQIVHFPVEA